MEIRLSDHFTYAKLIRFTMPSIVMMIFTSIYSVVDGFFISNFAGKTQFAAINFIMPFLNILATSGFMFGTGGTALVSKTYGEGDKNRANEYFSLLAYTSFGVGLALSVFGFIFVKDIAFALGARGDMLESCVQYSKILMVSLPFLIMQILFQSFFVAAEKPKLGLAVTILAGVTNIVLDAVLVISLAQPYKLFGAAVATAVSQIVGGVVPIFYFARKNKSILRLCKTSFYPKAVLKACTNGSSELMSNVSMNLVGVLYNIQLMKYAGENGVAAYGVMMYVSMIFSSAFIGYSIGSAPVIGYHNGAKNHTELKTLLAKSMKIICIFGLSMTVSAQILARPLSQFFVGYDKQLMDITISGFRIFALSFIFMGFAIFISSFFTALNDGATSAAVSFLRTLVFQTAAIILFPIIFEIDGIWMSIVAAEFMAFVIGTVFLIIKRKDYNY